jgi:signal transduction histidine kinase
MPGQKAGRIKGPREPAFGALLKELPQETATAIVLVRYGEPRQGSELRQILSKATGMPVEEVIDGTVAKPNRVFLVPAGADVIIRDGIFHLAEREELLSGRRELRALTGRLIAAQEASSQQQARELHDVFGLKVALLGMEIAALGKDSPKSGGWCDERWRPIAARVDDLGRDIHGMARRLHPVVLADLGLAAALKAECRAFGEQHGIPVAFRPRNIQRELPEDLSLCLYRVAQESLRNIGRHAAARTVRVALTGGASVGMVIEDAGAGFAPDEVRGKGGLGLVSMEERVRLAGGTFSIQSRPGKGTRVEVRVPVRQTAS